MILNRHKNNYLFKKINITYYNGKKRNKFNKL